MNTPMNPPNRTRGLTAAAWAAFLVAAATARADRVELRSGSTFEGVITAETEAHIVIETGGVPVKLKRGSIANIVKSATPPKPAAAPRAGEPTAEERKTPREFEGTDMKIQKLDALRQGLMPQAHVLTGHPARIQAAEARADRQHSVYAAALDQLNAFQVGTQAYNNAVDEVNQLAGVVEIMRAEITRLENELESARRTARSYHSAVDAFRADYQRRKNHFVEANPDHPALAGYFPRIQRRLDAHAQAGTGVYVVPCRFNGPHAYVKASLNGKAEVEWMVDTGATMCSIGSSLARRLKLPIAGDSQVTLADGRVARVPIAVIDQVTVGEVIVRNVACYVQDDTQRAESEKMDGLMGMSFLEHFEVQINAEERDLTLRVKSAPPAAGP